MPLVDTIRDWFSREKPSNETIPVVSTSAPVVSASVAAAASTTAPPLPAKSTPPKVDPVSPPVAPSTPNIAPQASSLAAEDNILTQALDEDKDTTEVLTNAVLTPYEDALQLLQNANTMEERSNVLLSHSFFTEGAGKAKQGFDAKMMVEVLKHLNDVYSSFGYQMQHQHRFNIRDNTPESKPQSWKITSWLGINHGLSWIERVTELAQQEPDYKETLRPQVHKLFGAWGNKNSELWPDIAELVLSAWGPISPRLIMGGLYHMNVADPRAEQPIEKYSNLSAFWNNPEYDGEWLQWCGHGNDDGLRMIGRHPRLNAWDLAHYYKSCGGDQDYMEDKIKKIADQDKGGALLKAWHGYELTVEEITKHPLAHSLYVHKHAPMYLEEVQPLPDSWNVALTLSQTGREFCDMLVMTAKAKISKAPVQSVELPDLGPNLG